VLPDFSVEAFRAYIYARKSKTTAVKYAQAATRFVSFCSRHNLSMDHLPPGVLSLFSDSLLHEGMKMSSVRAMCSGVSRYVDWCRNKGKNVPVMGSPDLPRSQRPPPNVLTGNALLSYLALASRLHEPIRTALVLLPFCGLRSFELSKLKLTDIRSIRVPGTHGRPDQDLIAFSVVGKGGKHRVVPLLLDGKPLLIAYLKRWRRTQRGPHLFPMGQRNEPISPRTLRHHVQAIRKRVGENRLTPHTLRRTYLTTLHRQGLDIPTLTRIAGHASVQTTVDHYLALENDTVAGSAAGIRLVERGPHSEKMAAATAGLSGFLSSSAFSRGVISVPDLPPTPPEDDERFP